MPEALIILGVALILFIVSARMKQKINAIKLNGLQAEGTIFEIEKVDNIDYPVIRFVTHQNDWITKRSDIAYFGKKGKKVKIIYQANNPENFIIDNRLTAIAPTIMNIIGFLLVVAAILILTGNIPLHENEH